MMRHHYVVGFRTPKYVIHRDGEDRPVAYADSHPAALQWIVIQVLADLINEEMSIWDDALQDVTEEILVNVFRLDITKEDPSEENGNWMKHEDYVLSKFPEAFRRVADQLEQEYRDRGLPVNPLTNSLHSVNPA